MAIPKIIHYCWFGDAPKPESVQKCINSWKKYCPDFEIREWTEKDFDVTQNPYTQQAYDAKIWGFVPDYIRLWIVYNYGGVYLDTDVQILRSFEPLLSNYAFAGFEKDTGNYVNLGQGFGAEPGNPIIAQNMHFYDDLKFLQDDGTYNRVPSPIYTTKILQEHGLNRDLDITQQLENITIYPADYFCPKSFSTGIIERTPNTFSIHHFDASWFTEEDRTKKETNWRKAKRSYYLHWPCRVAQRILGMERYLKIRALLKK